MMRYDDDALVGRPGDQPGELLEGGEPLRIGGVGDAELQVGEGGKVLESGNFGQASTRYTTQRWEKIDFNYSASQLSLPFPFYSPLNIEPTRNANIITRRF
ncbi:uncharacterized protein CCOS01_08759 [Colletotrichum costaricense]|uniref:Uncharacterized protein n=1 Tax=Colletotrichum costaricense TaxID=1209916 RepID=A0AAI9YW18_9PEZI|nr:uncharacterized protein CCOS01_08759 [Colletotrichum costaricense]KAK1526341.1 hypothetical protein CCOS01_08759 [Colletotrichum costaricense]